MFSNRLSLSEYSVIYEMFSNIFLHWMKQNGIEKETKAIG
jgi:hypothetical protein